MFFYSEPDSQTVQTDPYFYNTSLLLKMDSDFSDSSVHQHTVTTSGNVSVSNSEFKYDGGSGYFGGNGGYVAVSANPNFNFGTEDFTVEAWVYHIAGQTVLFSLGDGIYKVIRAGQDYINVETNVDGVSSVNVNFSSSLLSNQWNHIALVRNNNVLYAFNNGVIGQGVSYTKSIGNGNEVVHIGRKMNDPASTSLNGYIDDLRITKGVARYTANFTPPGSHPTTGPSEIVSTDLQLHLDAGNTSSYPGTGTTWYDLSGNGNDAFAENAIETTWNSEGYFDFERDLGPVPAFGLGLPTSMQVQAHAIEVWINPESINNSGTTNNQLYPVVSSQWEAYYSGISISVDGRAVHGGGPNAIHYQFGNGSSWIANQDNGNSPANSVSVGEWAQFIVTWAGNGTATKIYKNGQLIREMQIVNTTISHNGASWYIGKQPSDSGRRYDGKLSIVRLYSKGLTDSEVLQNFNATKDRFGL